MTYNWTANLLLAAGAMLAVTAVQAQPGKADLGKREYDNNCAVCHGTKGAGNGPYGELLKRSPPDLTTMAKRNGGVFPFAAAYATIEGAGPGHGTRDMPIWGQVYNVKGAEYYVDVPYDPNAFVRSRILALIDYLNRLQAK
jgi:mono/diheme cytochrome c family protein